jgi:hypothetical protein
MQNVGFISNKDQVNFVCRLSPFSNKKEEIEKVRPSVDQPQKIRLILSHFYFFWFM